MVITSGDHWPSGITFGHETCGPVFDSRVDLVRGLAPACALQLVAKSFFQKGTVSWHLPPGQNFGCVGRVKPEGAPAPKPTLWDHHTPALDDPAVPLRPSGRPNGHSPADGSRMDHRARHLRWELRSRREWGKGGFGFGLVGYHVRFTRERSRVRTPIRTLFEQAKSQKGRVGSGDQKKMRKLIHSALSPCFGRASFCSIFSDFWRAKFSKTPKLYSENSRWSRVCDLASPAATAQRGHKPCAARRLAQFSDKKCLFSAKCQRAAA